MKWFLKERVKDIEYIRDKLVYSLLPKNTNTPRVIKAQDGLISPDFNKPICMFCGFDSQSKVKSYVYYYLRALLDAGFDIVFVTSSTILEDIDMQKLRQFCVRVIHRENRGYDFYSWKTGLDEYVQFGEHNGLLLTNDSIIGPFFNLGDIVEQIKRSDADIVGLTDAWQFGGIFGKNYPGYLQSYFLYCKKQVIKSETFKHFFTNMKVLYFKRAIVRELEVGFSLQLGTYFSRVALFGVDRIMKQLQVYKRPKEHINLPIRYWRELITEMRYPFLKKSLLTQRRVSFDDLKGVLTEADSEFNLSFLDDLVSQKNNLSK